MSDIQLFRIQAGQATALQGEASDLEKPLQTLIEANLEVLLGIRFLATEYSTGKTHGGRIDTLGIDEDHCPVIIEYKRSVGENVINQGLFYLDWLMDHRAEFKLLVLEQLGKAAADAIDWSAPRLVCIAADFTKYDGHAVQQIQRSIELMRYRRFGSELLLLELAHAYSPPQAPRRVGSSPAVAVQQAQPPATRSGLPPTSTPAAVQPTALPTPLPTGLSTALGAKPVGPDKAYADILATLPEPLLDVLASLEDYTLSLGDDVQRKELRLYLAFKRIKNFASVVLQRTRVLLYLRLEPAHSLPAIQAVLPGARDVSQLGHWGTGDVELALATMADLDAAKPFIAQAYQGRGAAAA